MRFLEGVLGVAMAVCAGPVVGASGSRLDADAGSFIQRLYSNATSAFELGEFQGRYMPRRRCALMREFFVDELLKSRKGGDCDAKSADDVAFRRYPNQVIEELGPDASLEGTPKAHIVSSRLREGRAVVKVEFKGDPGRVVYFLRTTDRGWRIENALSYPIWPISMPPQGCSQLDAGGYFYLRDPSSLEELEDLPKQCREVERRYLDDRSRRHAHPMSHP